MAAILGFIFFFIVFLFIIYRINSQKTDPLSFSIITLAFAAKVLMGCLYGYIFLHYYGGDDTWMIHRESIDEYHELFNNPALFFSDFSPIPSFQQANSFFGGVGLYLANLEKQVVFKTIGLFNLFSRGNYYINSIFFNFIVFWGHYWLYRLLVASFPEKRMPLLLLIFFFPPVVFWLSGIRADGLLFFFTGLLLVQYNRWITGQHKRGLAWPVIALLFLFILRYAIAVVLLPALLAWWRVAKTGKRPLLTFTMVYAVSVVLFFCTTWISPSASLPSMIVNRQQEYFALHGNTRFDLDTLQATPAGFIRVLPQALHNTFVRPYIWEAGGPLQVIASLETLFFWLLVLWFFFRKEKDWKKRLNRPVLLTFVHFSFCLYIIIGLTVPFPGAIVRYKIIAELMLLTTIALCVKWPSFLSNYKKIHI